MLHRNVVNGSSVPHGYLPSTHILHILVIWLSTGRRTILWLMGSAGAFDKPRRSTRVPLKMVITIGDCAGSPVCEGETITVSLRGALIATSIALSSGMKISIHVYLTDKRAVARVVYIDPTNPLSCGVAFDEPQNIWGVPLPPDDWKGNGDFETEHQRLFHRTHCTLAEIIFLSS